MINLILSAHDYPPIGLKSGECNGSDRSQAIAGRDCIRDANPRRTVIKQSNMTTPSFGRTWLIALLLLATGWSRAAAADQIMFLHLKLKDGAITLVSSAVKPGRLKTPLASDQKGTIHLELTATNGATLWSDVVADPTVRRLEYEDPENPGTLKIKEVKTAEAEFTVRIPNHPAAQKLRLQRLDKPLNRATAAAAPDATKKQLGTVALPAAEAAQ
jgi:hypothetical protein